MMVTPRHGGAPVILKWSMQEGRVFDAAPPATTTNEHAPGPEVPRLAVLYQVKVKKEPEEPGPEVPGSEVSTIHDTVVAPQPISAAEKTKAAIRRSLTPGAQKIFERLRQSHMYQSDTPIVPYGKVIAVRQKKGETAAVKGRGPVAFMKFIEKAVAVDAVDHKTQEGLDRQLDRIQQEEKTRTTSAKSSALPPAEGSGSQSSSWRATEKSPWEDL